LRVTARHHGEIPVTIGVFVDPGVFHDEEDPKNRNAEYDAFDDRHVNFLLTEIIPRVTQRYSITEEPDRWGICGGNCAFTAAWFRPDTFRRVVCCLSSFTQMPDGNPYPDLIPSVPRKPVRIFMQTGHRELWCAGGPQARRHALLSCQRRQNHTHRS
jgi:enterochelin esterase-like enzyme